MDVLAARERDLDLRVRAREIDPRRHERQAALCHARTEPVNLAAVQQDIDRQAKLGLLKSDIDVAKYADLSLVDEAAKRTR